MLYRDHLEERLGGCKITDGVHSSHRYGSWKAGPFFFLLTGEQQRTRSRLCTKRRRSLHEALGVTLSRLATPAKLSNRYAHAPTNSVTRSLFATCPIVRLHLYSLTHTGRFVHTHIITLLDPFRKQ